MERYLFSIFFLVSHFPTAFFCSELAVVYEERTNRIFLEERSDWPVGIDCFGNRSGLRRECPPGALFSAWRVIVTFYAIDFGQQS